MNSRRLTWLFDLDNTLHDASHAAFGPTNQAMTDYIAEHLGVSHEEAWSLRQHYWKRYGATLLGLVKHHGVKSSGANSSRACCVLAESSATEASLSFRRGAER